MLPRAVSSRKGREGEGDNKGEYGKREREITGIREREQGETVVGMQRWSPLMGLMFREEKHHQSRHMGSMGRLSASEFIVTRHYLSTKATVQHSTPLSYPPCHSSFLPLPSPSSSLPILSSPYSFLRSLIILFSLIPTLFIPTLCTPSLSLLHVSRARDTKAASKRPLSFWKLPYPYK